jgi:hypothetical protein
MYLKRGSAILRNEEYSVHRNSATPMFVAQLTNLRNASRRNGKPASCEPCRINKTRCDHGMPKCDRCKQRGIEERCFYHPAPLTKPRHIIDDAGTAESRPLKRKYELHIASHVLELTTTGDHQIRHLLSLCFPSHLLRQTTSSLTQLLLMSITLAFSDLALMPSCYPKMKSREPLESAKFRSLQRDRTGN